jgi:hypothetical protein
MSMDSTQIFATVAAAEMRSQAMNGICYYGKIWNSQVLNKAGQGRNIGTI